MNDIAKTIEREVLSWSGVTAEPDNFGGIDRVNSRLDIRDYLAV